jgi:Tfp pilus assembly protein PilF
MPFARRRWVVVAPLALMLGLTLATTPSSAQLAKEWKCTGLLDQIGDCTAAIQSGKFAGKDLARVLANRGVAYLAKGDHDRAVADYDAAIRLDPGFALAYDRRGVVFGRKGDADRAIADFTQAIRLDPKLLRSYGNRAVVYFSKGEFDRAIADFTEVIRLAPESRGTHPIQTHYYNRGLAYSRKGDLDHAIADFTEALKINPRFARAYFGRGLAKQGKADQSGSEADIARAREIDPKVASAQLNPVLPPSELMEQLLKQSDEVEKPGTASGSTTLTASETRRLISRFASCWYVPTELRNADLKVTVQLKLAKDGSLTEPPKVLNSNSNPDPRFAVAAKSAIAGVTKCAPFDFLPAAKYAAWREMIIDFDPRDMFGDKPR